MLTGKNGVLNRANEAKYTNEVAQFEEKVKLAQIALQTSITAKTKSQLGYIATEENNFATLADEVAKDLDVTAIKAPATEGTKIKTEGYTVAYYLDTEGNSATDGHGYIVIWYTDNSLRSSMNREEAILKHNLKDITENKSVNQAVLVSVIHVENYGCELASQKGLTSTTDADEDIGKEKYEETSLNENLEFENASTGGGSEPTLITFYISSQPYQAEEGMTWGEWIEDVRYNTDNIKMGNDQRLNSSGEFESIVSNGGDTLQDTSDWEYCFASSPIKEGHYYNYYTD